LIFLALTSSKSFQTGFGCLSCLPRKVSHSKQAVMFHYAFAFTTVSSQPLSRRSDYFNLIRFSYQDIFLILTFIYQEYKKLNVLINKQFSIDSFLDWGGHLWDFCLSHSSAYFRLHLHSSQSTWLAKRFEFWENKKNISVNVKVN